MNLLYFITASTVQLFISALMFLLCIRAVMGIFAEEDSKLLVFSSVVTEPVVAPVRKLLSKISFLDEMPIDLSFLTTCLILMFIQSALPL